MMINDLVVENARLWKYVDDTTISETVAKGEPSNVQRHTDNVGTLRTRTRCSLETPKPRRAGRERRHERGKKQS